VFLSGEQLVVPFATEPLVFLALAITTQRIIILVAASNPGRPGVNPLFCCPQFTAAFKVFNQW
jgi:hypothetical protein